MATLCTGRMMRFAVAQARVQCMISIPGSSFVRSMQAAQAFKALPPAVLNRSGTSRSYSRAVSCSALADKLKSDMKDAMRARDQVRLDAIRLVNAAIKSREIELRAAGTIEVTDAEVIKVVQKMTKQRRDSIESYRAGGRQDLVDKEQLELEIIEAYLPAQLSREEVEAIVAQAVADTGATSVKQMKAVMSAVASKTQGRADNKTVSELIKAKLSS